MTRLTTVLEESGLYLIFSSLVAFLLFACQISPCFPPLWLPSIRVAAGAALWYSISISFSVFNKTFLTLWMGGWNYPIITTTVHMLLKVLISRTWIHCTHGNAPIHPLSSSTFLWVITPIGVCTAADVMFSNLAIVYVPLSTYTAIKGSVAIFSYFAAIFFGLEEFSFPLLISLSGIALGLAIAVVSSTNATVLGILFCFAAAASGGLRWAVTQLLLQTRKDCKDNFMLAIAMFSPTSFLSILPLSAIELERFVDVEIRDNSWWILCEALLLCIGGGVIAFFLIAIEMYLLTLTSSINLGVLGQVKEMLQILLSIVIFRERLNLQSVVGIGIAIASGIAYRLFNRRPKDDEVVAAEVVEVEAEVEEAEAAKPLIEMRKL